MGMHFSTRLGRRPFHEVHRRIAAIRSFHTFAPAVTGQKQEEAELDRAADIIRKHWLEGRKLSVRDQHEPG